MNDIEKFQQEREKRLTEMTTNDPVRAAAREFMAASIRSRYSYNFDWMGVPIIQYPQDVFALQEIIWRTKPDMIIETGVARGGSLIFYASMLKLLGSDHIVIGIDIDIRPHNRAVIEDHPMAGRIHLIEGSSVAPETLENVARLAAPYTNPMVILDSNHSHDHVLDELRAYQNYVRAGSYLIVLDTVIEYLPNSYWTNRPWGAGNNSMTAVDAFLSENKRFEIDPMVDNKLLISVAPRGYLKCTVS